MSCLILAMYEHALNDWHFPSCLFPPPFLIPRVPTDRYQTTPVLATSNSSGSDCHSPRQTEPDLLYLNILNDAVKETAGPSRHRTTSSTPCRPSPEDRFTPRNYRCTKLTQLDELDNEYLAKKGVFDLPSPHHL
jgi:hypothetical protein